MATQEEIQAVLDDRFQALELLRYKGRKGLITFCGQKIPPDRAIEMEIEWLYGIQYGGPETVNDLIWRGKPVPAQVKGLREKILSFIRPKAQAVEDVKPIRQAKLVVSPPHAVGGVISCHKPQRRSGAMRCASR